MSLPEWVGRLDQAGSNLVFTVPNVLSLFRLAMVPAFLILYMRHAYAAAVLAFAIAAVTDLFDGLLARLLEQRSRLGAILDPLADKALGLAAILAMTLNHRLPLWFLAITLFRDAVVVLIAAVARARHVRLKPRPSRIGKSATFFVNAAVILALIHQIAYAPWLTPVVVALILIAGESVLAAALQYLVRFGPVLWGRPVPQSG